MKKPIRITAALLLAAALMALMAACSSGDTKKEKTYKWGETEFKVTDITDDESVIGDQKNTMEGKGVAVKIDFGEGTISQSQFEQNVARGMLMLAGKKPKNYNYHMANMTLGANGFVAQITGETVIFFDMDKDYKINPEDLVIKDDPAESK